MCLGEWLEYSLLLIVLFLLLVFGWLFNEFVSKLVVIVIVNFNIYNFLFILLGLLLYWCLCSFFNVVVKVVLSIIGVLIQFLLYGGIVMIFIYVVGGDGQILVYWLLSLFVYVVSIDLFVLVMGVYLVVLGFFVLFGGGKWIIEVLYVMQVVNELKVYLGWVVQVYNVVEVLLNLINLFWMLLLLGVLGLKVCDIVGFIFIQLLVYILLVLGLLWLLGMILVYVLLVMF